MVGVWIAPVTAQVMMTLPLAAERSICGMSHSFSRKLLVGFSLTGGECRRGGLVQNSSLTRNREPLGRGNPGQQSLSKIVILPVHARREAGIFCSRHPTAEQEVVACPACMPALAQVAASQVILQV
jgi:hypothetical protein